MVSINSVKVIFLDIDGVLNYRDYFILQRLKRKQNKKIIEDDIDDEKVKLLAKIVELTKAIIVLSSSWRILEEDSLLYQMLVSKLNKYNLKIADKTPNINADRKLEIQTWLEKHPEVESFVILEDSDYEWGELAEHWVATSFYEENGGLREEHVEKALYILNNKRRVRNGAGK